MFFGYRIRQHCQSGISEEPLLLLHKYLKRVCCFHDKNPLLIYSIYIVPFCQTIFKCLILISSHKAYLKNRQSFHPHFYPLWHYVVTTTWQLLEKQNIIMENIKVLRVNFPKLEFSKPIQGPSWAPVGFFEASGFPNQPKDLFSERNENLNIIKPY